MTLPSSLPAGGAVPSVQFVVIDASTLIALSAQEPGRFAVATTEINRYAQGGSRFHAPNVIVSEAQFALCRKQAAGLLTASENAQAIQSLHVRMRAILPPPNGEASQLLRAEQLRVGYGCSRSADSLSPALAEELTQIGTTQLLTFDQDLPKQAARNAPTVNVHLLT